MQTALMPAQIQIQDKKFDLAKAVKLRLKNGLTYEEIGAIFGVCKQTAHTNIQRFLKLLPTEEEVENYDRHKSKILTSLELKLIEKMSDETAIKEASLNNAAYAFQQINNANRLEKGLATSIYDNFTIEADLAELQKREAELMREIQVKVLDCDKSNSGNTLDSSTNNNK